MKTLTLFLCGLALAISAAPAAAAGRCGDVAQRPWCDTDLGADARAGLLLAALTRDERISLLAGDELSGVAGAEGTHTGTSNGVERVGLPPVFFSDGPVGTRQGKATGMPSPMSLAASFDPLNAFRHATIVGDEVKKKGNDIVFAPAVNMLRTPLNGRTFEYFGEDPFLSAELTVGWTRGVQSEGIIGNVKHYAVNNQEGAGAAVPGSPLGTPVTGSRLTVDARLDERTLREIYLPQFEAAVTRGGVGSVMCSYPRVNGAYACENQHLLEDVLKGDWGFDGFVLTDYGAAKSTVNSLNNGLDLDIWPAVVYRPELVNAALASSQASEASVDEHVRRILRTLFAFGFFDRGAYVDDTTKIDQDAHHAAAADIEQQGIVLLENDKALLPLDAASARKVAVIGPEADVIKDGGGSSAINEFKTTTALDALQERVGNGNVVFEDGSDVPAAASAAKAADVAVVVVGDRMTEGSDKPCMGLNCGQTDGIDRDALIEAVAAAQPRTVVVLQSGGPTLTPWRGKVPALLEAWYPGQNGGTAIARTLFGDAEPGGRLPATFPLREADEPVSGDPEKYPGVGERVTYKEGVLIGYRWFDDKRLDVAYPFGHGLSYTSFAYRGLRIRPGAGDTARVSVEVRNTGRSAGTEVAQLYLGLPDPSASVRQPPKALKGIRKVRLRAGQRRRVSFAIDRRALSYWDAAADAWAVAPGCSGVMVGRSSRDIRLRGTLAVRARCAKPARRCLSRRAPIGRRNIGRLSVGRTRAQMARRITPVKRAPQLYRWCVRRASRRVTAVFGGRTAASRARLIVTTARRHGNRRVRPGSRTRALRRAFPGLRRVARGVYRASRRNPHLFGVRKGRVSFIGVADGRLLRDPRGLRRMLRRAGL